MKIKGIDITRPVKVYRNLKHGRKARPLYSVMQDGKVKARLHRVLLSTCKFVVNEAGRQRVLKEKRKNVHAFVVGIIRNNAYIPKSEIAGCMGIDENGRDMMPVVYNPYKAGYFMSLLGNKIIGAGGVLLNERGLSAAYTY